MNERIKQLEIQSVFYNEDTQLWEFDREKFAELIVQECMSLAQSYPSQNDDYAAGIDIVRDSIKEHFGV